MSSLDLAQIVGAFHDCTSRHIPSRVAAAVAEAGEQLADLTASGITMTPEAIRAATTLGPLPAQLQQVIWQHYHLPEPLAAPQDRQRATVITS